MRLYLDSADEAAVCDLLGVGIFTGVTTNPTLMEQSGLRYEQVPSFYSAVVDAGASEVFFQAAGGTSAAFEAHGRELASVGARVVVKVPATRAGLSAAAQLAGSGVAVLVTAVYTVAQAVAAGRLGARYIAPYVGRMTDAGRDGIAVVADMQRALRGSGTEVLAASIRTVDVIDALAVAGIDTVSIGPAVAASMLSDESTDSAARTFERAAAALRAPRE